MASSPLTVFVSSKMEELAPERLAIKAALEELEIDGWLFDKDAGARPQSIQETFLEEVERSDLYIGLFWKGYGDYTIEEFKHAQSLNKDCLLYEKRTALEGRDERLAKWLAELDDVENGLTKKWFNTPEELKEFVKQDVAGWQAAIVRRYKVAGAPQVYQPPQPVQNRTRKELSILLNKVEQFWIKGVLDQSVHRQFEIELGKERMGEAIAHPWESMLEVPNQAESPTPAGVNTSDLFVELDRYLLILGQPGSGKTITLLQLARDLIAAARKDATEPIPTVFNLSSWTNKDEPILDWMVRELTEKYQVPKKIGREWLDQHLLFPLLDGLDEVRADLQADCLSAVNKFIDESPSGLVVCCRLQEYMSLPARLKLNGAICLQPLSLNQVQDYLEKAGPSLAALKDRLAVDNSLRELIQTPLMLSIISLAYEHAPLQALNSNSGGTVESLRADVFDTYIERVMQRKGKAGRVYDREKLNRWLGWLARQMKSHSQTIFLIEQLQANWLPTRRQRFFYTLISRLLGGLLLGAGFGLAFAVIAYRWEWTVKTSLYAWLISLALGLGVGVVSVLISYIKGLVNERVGFVRGLTGWRRSVTNVAVYALTWFVLGAITTLVLSEASFETILLGLVITLGVAPIVGLIHWFLFEARSDRHRTGADITTVETLKWSWKAALKSGLKGGITVGLLLLPVGIILSLLLFGVGGFSLDSLFATLLIIAVLVFVYGGFGGAIGFAFGGFKEGVIEKKTKPNQGIKLTIRNAVVGGVTIGLLSGVAISLLFISSEYLSTGDLALIENVPSFAEAFLIMGLAVAFRTGLYDTIKHYTLRFLLASSKHIPRHYVKILNYAVTLILLQRVGGGYIFIHRTLLEHYAATYGRDDQLVVAGQS